MTEAELRSFFTAYGNAFLETEVEVAEFYNVPCITARQGVVRLNATQDDLRSFWGDVLRRYRERGNTQGELRSIKWESLGANSMAATICWAYKDVTGRVLWEWTFTYNLYKGSEGWKILLQTLHDEA